MGITTVGWQCLLGSLGSFVALGSEEMRTEAEVEEGPRESQPWVSLLVKGRAFSMGQSPPPMSLA